MQDILIVPCHLTKSGQLFYFGGTTYVNTGWQYCQAGQTHPTAQWRGYFSFDTSSIPDHATIDVVSFRCKRAADPVGTPELYELRFCLGSFIGAALDASDWDGGDLMISLDAKPADKALLDLSADGEDPTVLVDTSGETDVRVWDNSTQGSGDASWNTKFNPLVTGLCKLEVVFTIPSATASAAGTIEAAGVAIYAASATASAAGTIEAAGVAIYAASATASAAGTIEAAGSLAVPALAVHTLTISISASDTGTISVSAVNSATISAAGDELSLGARSN